MSALLEQRKKAYQKPEFETFGLSAIVMSGATGGGDSGQTGFNDDPTSDDPRRDEYGDRDI